MAEETGPTGVAEFDPFNHGAGRGQALQGHRQGLSQVPRQGQDQRYQRDQMNAYGPGQTFPMMQSPYGFEQSQTRQSAEASLPFVPGFAQQTGAFSGQLPGFPSMHHVAQQAGASTGFSPMHPVAQQAVAGEQLPVYPGISQQLGAGGADQEQSADATVGRRQPLDSGYTRSGDFEQDRMRQYMMQQQPRSREPRLQTHIAVRHLQNDLRLPTEIEEMNIRRREANLLREKIDFENIMADERSMLSIKMEQYVKIAESKFGIDTAHAQEWVSMNFDFIDHMITNTIDANNIRDEKMNQRRQKNEKYKEDLARMITEIQRRG